MILRKSRFFRLLPKFEDKDGVAFLRIRNTDPDIVGFDQLHTGRLCDEDVLSNYRFIPAQHGAFPAVLGNDAFLVITCRPEVVAVKKYPFSSDIQFYDISTLLNATFLGQVPQYFLWNNLNVWDCFDEKASRVRYSENNVGERYVSTIYQYAFDFSKAGISASCAENAIFRITDDRRRLFAGWRVVDQLREHNIFEFQDVCY